jgi:predicted metal-dependent hydrolase
MNALSIFIPFSERTVSEILRSNLPKIQDGKLKQQTLDTIKQEGRHAAMHRQSNILIGQSYNGLKLIGKIQSNTMNLIRAVSSNAFEMCMPATFEHFTSAVSREILSNQQEWIGEQDNQAIDFMLWHCLEELEHQAICHDAYKALYRSRIRLFLSLALWVPLSMVSIYSIQMYLLHKDRIIYKPRNWMPYLKFLIKSAPLFYRGSIDFCRNGFNPWSDSDQALYQASLKKQHNFYSNQ